MSGEGCSHGARDGSLSLLLCSHIVKEQIDLSTSTAYTCMYVRLQGGTSMCHSLRDNFPGDPGVGSPCLKQSLLFLATAQHTQSKQMISPVSTRILQLE